MLANLAVLWGLGCSFLSAAFTSLGLGLQKRARNDCLATNANLSQNSYYILGLSYVALSLCLKMIVYALLPLVSISVLSTQTIIYSHICDHILVQKINFHSPLVLFSLSSITFGLLMVLFGSNLVGSDFGSISEMSSLLFTQNSILFTVLMILILIIGKELLRVRAHEVSTTWKLVFSSLLASFVAGMFGVLLRIASVAWCYHLFIDKSILSGGFLLTFFTILAVLLGLAKTQCVKVALTDFQVSEFLPVYQGFSLIMSIICGLVYLQEAPSTQSTYHPASTTEEGETVDGYYSGGSGVFILGTIFVLAGLVVNYWRPVLQDDDEDDSLGVYTTLPTTEDNSEEGPEHSYHRESTASKTSMTGSYSYDNSKDNDEAAQAISVQENLLYSYSKLSNSVHSGNSTVAVGGKAPTVQHPDYVSI